MGRYRPTMKHENCCARTVAAKTRKNLLLAVTTGFSGPLRGCCTVVIQMGIGMQMICFFKEKEFAKWALDNTILAE